MCIFLDSFIHSTVGAYYESGDWYLIIYTGSLLLLHEACNLLEKTDIDQDVACSYVFLTCGSIHRANFLAAFKMDFFFLKLQNLPSQIVVQSHNTGKQIKMSIFSYFLDFFFFLVF